MDAPPLVSIITPVLNGARFLPDLLASVRAQDHPRLEHVVIDGGSTDGTLDLLEATPGLVWVTGRDRGLYDAINKGLRLAQGEVVTYQNADDRYASPEAVSSAVAFLCARPDVDVAYGGYRFIDEAGRPLRRGEIRPPEFRLWLLKHHSFVPPHATFLRSRVVARDSMLIDPGFRFAGDWDWFLRLALAGRRFARLDRLVAEFRRHADTQTSRLPLDLKKAEFQRIARRGGGSYALLLWYELYWMPLKRRLGWRAFPRRHGERASPAHSRR
jgi:glycosyltransferase involved in cell wall biosynthesis